MQQFKQTEIGTPYRATKFREWTLPFDTQSRNIMPFLKVVEVSAYNSLKNISM